MQFVITYSLFKTHVTKATSPCNFLFSDHLNSALISLVDLMC